MSKGFTIVELLTVIAIIALLAALVLPAMNSALRHAESATCAGNLHNIGVALCAYSVANRSYLCSGAFDMNRDGDIRKVGWVADLRNYGSTDPGASLCPSNPTRISAKWNDICEASFQSTTGGVGDLSPLPRKLTLAESVQAFKEGYNTNYAASWYLVRTAMRPEYTDNVGLPLPGHTPWAMRDCKEPLSLSRLEGPILTTPGRVPLIGDASYGTFAAAAMTYELPGCFRKGQLGCVSFTAGPIALPDGTVGQDYTGFAPWHGGGRKKWCNILFADFHAASVMDRNGDGCIGYTGDSGAPGDLGELDGRVFPGNLLARRN